MEGVKKTIKLKKNNNASGSDKISTELLKSERKEFTRLYTKYETKRRCQKSAINHLFNSYKERKSVELCCGYKKLTSILNHRLEENYLPSTNYIRLSKFSANSGNIIIIVFLLFLNNYMTQDTNVCI